jgi:hypothetical protein
VSAPTIELGIALGVPEAGDFIIGDATRGLIGSTEFTIASGYTTVTGDAYSISIRRGRFSRLWDSFDAGSSTVSVWNHDRAYDPSYLLSPYSGYIVPGRALRVQAGDFPIWTGFVDDIDLSYEVSGQSAAMFKATDVLGVLGQMQFDAWTSSGVDAATKLTEICDRSEVAWTSALREFDSGVELLQSDSVSWGSNVKNYADLIARSDLGYLFASADGVLTFRNRLATSGVATACSFSDAGGTFDAPLYDDSNELLYDNSGDVLTGAVDSIGFSNIEATIGSELLFARVGVDREGGTNQTATVADLAAWQLEYGPPRSLSITGLLLASDAQSLALAEFILKLYDTPRYRVSEIDVDLHGLSALQQSAVLALDIASVVEVEFQPNRVGDPIHQHLVVQGLAHDISVDRHTVTLSLIDAPLPYFRIGDAIYGVIGGEYTIGF